MTTYRSFPDAADDAAWDAEALKLLMLDEGTFRKYARANETMNYGTRGFRSLGFCDGMTADNIAVFGRSARRLAAGKALVRACIRMAKQLKRSEQHG